LIFTLLDLHYAIKLKSFAFVSDQDASPS
jgi:hypothetical protein